jgi:hypothetical protein
MAMTPWHNTLHKTGTKEMPPLSVLAPNVLTQCS